MFFGLFGGRMTTDNSVTRIEQEGERRNVQNAVDLQVRMRQRHTMLIEGDLDDAYEEIKQKNARIRELESERVAFFNLARNIAIDRRSIWNTLKERPDWEEIRPEFEARVEVWKEHIKATPEHMSWWQNWVEDLIRKNKR